MKAAIIGLFAETSLHPGTESSTGVIDLPVAREAITGYPVVVGSSLKGALKDKARQEWPPQGNGDGQREGKGKDGPLINKLFGWEESAGTVSFTDARLLLLPVRSLTGHYKWVTCPYLLERYQRDSKMAGNPLDFDIPHPGPGDAVSAGNGYLYLEELAFSIVSQDISGVAEAIAPLIGHQSVRGRLGSQIAIVGDDQFKHFAVYALQVNARNELSEAKASKNLWYEETIPPDSLFYSVLITRPGSEAGLEDLRQLFIKEPYLQMGGNETVGQGWCAVSWLDGGVARVE